jgi:hypothetical protein
MPSLREINAIRQPSNNAFLPIHNSDSGLIAK